MSDVQQLIDASRLYYELGETQSRVAELLGVTRPQVSRILKRARAEGIVEIRIVDQAAQRRPPARSCASGSGSSAVHLAASIRGPEDVGRRLIGRLGADVLRAAIRDGAVVGVGDGSSISALADALDEPLRETGATVVPLCGGYWFTGPAREPFRRVADGIGGVPQGLLAPGPRRRPGDEAVARRPRRRPPDPRSVGPARRRGLRDRRADLERGRVRADDVPPSSRRPERSARC